MLANSKDWTYNFQGIHSVCIWKLVFIANLKNFFPSLALPFWVRCQKQKCPRQEYCNCFFSGEVERLAFIDDFFHRQTSTQKEAKKAFRISTTFSVPINQGSYQPSCFLLHIPPLPVVSCRQKPTFSTQNIHSEFIARVQSKKSETLLRICLFRFFPCSVVFKPILATRFLRQCELHKLFMQTKISYKNTDQKKFIIKLFFLFQNN